LTQREQTPVWTQKNNFSTVFAGQAAGIEEAHDDIRLVSFMDYAEAERVG